MAAKSKAAKPKSKHVGFKKLSGQLATKGASNPNALAAFIGRKKLGAKKMSSLAAKGRSKASKKK